MLLINIAGRPVSVHKSPIQSHFTNINILGVGFFKYYNISHINDFNKLTVKLYFGTGWRMVKESSTPVSTRWISRVDCGSSHMVISGIFSL